MADLKEIANNKFIPEVLIPMCPPLFTTQDAIDISEQNHFNIPPSTIRATLNALRPLPLGKESFLQTVNKSNNYSNPSTKDILKMSTNKLKDKKYYVWTGVKIDIREQQIKELERKIALGEEINNVSVALIEYYYVTKIVKWPFLRIGLINYTKYLYKLLNPNEEPSPDGKEKPDHHTLNHQFTLLKREIKGTQQPKIIVPATPDQIRRYQVKNDNSKEEQRRTPVQLEFDFGDFSTERKEEDIITTLIQKFILFSCTKKEFFMKGNEKTEYQSFDSYESKFFHGMFKRIKQLDEMVKELSRKILELEEDKEETDRQIEELTRAKETFQVVREMKENGSTFAHA
jgi:hypothetical protein